MIPPFLLIAFTLYLLVPKNLRLHWHRLYSPKDKCYYHPSMRYRLQYKEDDAACAATHASRNRNGPSTVGDNALSPDLISIPTAEEEAASLATGVLSAAPSLLSDVIDDLTNSLCSSTRGESTVRG